MLENVDECGAINAHSLLQEPVNLGEIGGRKVVRLQDRGNCVRAEHTPAT
jgi:hypothetical protein